MVAGQLVTSGKAPRGSGSAPWVGVSSQSWKTWLDMRSKIIRALSLSLVDAGPHDAAAQQQPTGTWAAETSSDYKYYGTCCTDGTYLYILGGYQGVGSTTPEYYARFRRYDPAGNSWTNMPQIASGTTTGSTVWGYLYPGA